MCAPWSLLQCLAHSRSTRQQGGRSCWRFWVCVELSLTAMGRPRTTRAHCCRITRTAWVRCPTPVFTHRRWSVFTWGSRTFPHMLIKHVFAANLHQSQEPGGRRVFKIHKEQHMTEMLSPFQVQPGALWKSLRPPHGDLLTASWTPVPGRSREVSCIPSESAQGLPPGPASCFLFHRGVSQIWDLRAFRKHTPSLPHCRPIGPSCPRQLRIKAVWFGHTFKVQVLTLMGFTESGYPNTVF